MYTEYLKNNLAELAAVEVEQKRIRAEYAITNNGSPSYPSICGAMDVVITRAAYTAKAMLNWTSEHIEPAEKQAERFVSIFEALGIETDEETLATLELIGKRTYIDNPREFRENSPYRDERNQIANLISKLVSEVQESEREREHDEATDAILKAGFIHNEDTDAFMRDRETVVIELTSGRESRYKWGYAGSKPNGDALVDSGKSGEFSRLIDLIAPKQTSDSACGVVTAVTPCDTEVQR